jgi:hypothetical protein
MRRARGVEVGRSHRCDIDALCQAGRGPALRVRPGGAPRRQHPCDLAELALHAGGDDERPAPALGHGRARLDHVPALGERERTPANISWTFSTGTDSPVRAPVRRAATGATAGLIHGLFGGFFGPEAPDPVVANFVDRCLREKGYELVGWK